MPVKVLLKEMRTKRGLSQNELARKIEMSLNAVQHIEYKAKAIQLDTLGKLCEVLNCQPGDLLVWAPDDNAKQETTLEQEKSEQVKQGGETIGDKPPIQRQHARSFLSVIPEDLESA